MICIKMPKEKIMGLLQIKINNSKMKTKSKEETLISMNLLNRIKVTVLSIQVTVQIHLTMWNIQGDLAIRNNKVSKI